MSFIKIILFIILIVSSFSTAFAAPPAEWSKTSVAVECRSNNIRDVFSNLSEFYNINVELEDSVSGQCYGWLKHNSIIIFLDSISSTYGLSWYFFNNILYVTDTNNFKIEQISISSEMHAALRSIKIIEPKYGWSFLKETDQVLVNGPQSYIDNVKAIIDTETTKKKTEKSSSKSKTKSKSKSKEPKPDSDDIYIIEISHASVMDRRIDIRGSSIVIPGILSVLNNIINSTGMTDSSKESSSTETLLGLSKGGGSTNIQADTRTNSIIIRSTEHPESYFRSIISRLDKPLELVEIDAMIIDVNRDVFYEIGNRYGYSSNQNTDSVSINNTSSTGDIANNLSAVLNIGDYAKFFADIRMLEGNGQANIVANTSILTIENQPALIDLSNTFYIRNVTENVAATTPVTTGTLLNITPQLLKTEEEVLEVQLIVNVEDGTILDQVVDGIPIVSRSKVSTKAIIEEGKSLVIGGYRLQTTTKSRRSVPLIGNIPLIKELFTYKSSETSDRERLFVITPRISLKSHEPAKKLKSNIHRHMNENINEIISLNTNSDYSNVRVEKTAEMFQAILEKREIVTSYNVSEYASLGAPFSCYSNKLSYEFFGLPSFTNENITVYKIKVNNNSQFDAGIPENSCKGQGLIAAVNTASRTLKPGDSSFLLVAFDNIMVQK